MPSAGHHVRVDELRRKLDSYLQIVKKPTKLSLTAHQISLLASVGIRGNYRGIPISEYRDRPIGANSAPVR